MYTPSAMPQGISSGEPFWRKVFLKAPVRLLETRAGLPGCITPGAKIAASSITILPGRYACTGVPPTAVAIFGNSTSINVTVAGNFYLTYWASNEPQPTAATQNGNTAKPVENAYFECALSPGGQFSVFTNKEMDLIIDIVGYYLKI